MLPFFIVVVSDITRHACRTLNSLRLLYSQSLGRDPLRTNHRRLFPSCAVACHDFGDEGRWLIQDVSVRCGSDEHSSITMLAWTAAAVYPIGLLLTTAVRHAAIELMTPEPQAPAATSVKAHARCTCALPPYTLCL